MATALAMAHGESVEARTSDYELAHHIRGRVRFYVPRLARDQGYAERVRDAALRLPWVRQVRVSRAAASIIVTYDPSVLPGPTGLGAADSGWPVVPALGECIASAGSATDTRSSVLPPLETRVPYARHLGVPMLALGLATASAVGVAIPGPLVGTAVLAATVPHARRALQGIRQERRLTVEILDVTTCLLLVARSTFLPAAFTMAVIETAEVARSWTGRRSHRQASRDVPATSDGTTVELAVATEPSMRPPLTPQMEDARVSDYARRTGDRAVSPTLGLGVLAGALSGGVGQATGIVSLDMGTGMRVSAPIAILTAQSRALASGILFRSGRAVETLGVVDTILFGPAVSHPGEEVVRGMRDRDIDVQHLPRALAPRQQAQRVQALQDGGRRVVVVVGDDDELMAAAQAGLAVAFDGAVAAVTEAADVVLSDDRPYGLLQAIDIARHALVLVRQNQRLVVAGNASGIAYGAVVAASPIGGALLNNGVALIAALNSLRAPGPDAPSGASTGRDPSTPRPLVTAAGPRGVAR